jgi:hypothetical protein
VRIRVLIAAVAVAGLLAMGVTSAQAAEPVTCGGRIATIVGTQGRDVVRGTAGDDVIASLGGDDVVNGMGGDDTICGGTGHDVVHGGRGDDSCAGEVAQCEGRVLGSSDFPFSFEPSQDPLVNGKADNRVIMGFVPTFGTVETELWVSTAFYNGEQFNGSDPGFGWNCSLLTTGLPRGATGGVACEYTGTTPDNPGLLVYQLGVNLPHVPASVDVLYCGGSTPGDFTSDSCTIPPVNLPVGAPS